MVVAIEHALRTRRVITHSYESIETEIVEARWTGKGIVWRRRKINVEKQRSFIAPLGRGTEQLRREQPHKGNQALESARPGFDRKTEERTVGGCREKEVRTSSAGAGAL